MAVLHLILVMALQLNNFAFSRNTYGCKYSTSLCNRQEYCIDDNLFGICQKYLQNKPDTKLALNPAVQSLLKFALQGLLDLGYGWSDTYTQCIVGGLLESYKLSHSPELAYCDAEERSRISLTEQTQKNKSAQRKRFGDNAEQTAEESQDTIELHDFLGSGPLLQQFNNRFKVRDNKPTANADITVEDPSSAPPLSREDKWLLDQLIRNAITVADLTTPQIHRLKQYLQSALHVTESSSPHPTTPTDEVVQSVSRGTTPKTQPLPDDALIIEEVLKKFADESRSESQKANYMRLSNDVLGQHISEQLRLLGVNQYDVKKANTQSENVGSTASISSSSSVTPTIDAENSDVIDSSYIWFMLDKPINETLARNILTFIAKSLELSHDQYSNVEIYGNQVSFQIRNPENFNKSAEFVQKVKDYLKNEIYETYGVVVQSTGIGHNAGQVQISSVGRVYGSTSSTTIIVITVVVVVVLILLVVLTWSCMYKKWLFSIKKFEKLSNEMKGESTQDSYEDLCRQRIQSAASPSDVADTLGDEKDQMPPLRIKQERSSVNGDKPRSPLSSTSSWNEEPVTLNMDISTGHAVLSYMEDHLKNKHRLKEEWNALCDYTPDLCDAESGKMNPSRNRYPNNLPYDHNRVKLSHATEGADTDYINASFIAEDDPRSPSYIATQGPMQSTVAHFWQMVWEQDCTSIVMLTPLAENNKTVCYQYWPSEGKVTYGHFEVHLVSEHIWCEAYLIRSFYLKNLETNLTRTITQFHFLSWPDTTLPDSVKDLLDFRRKVNKSYKGKSSPTVVLCSNGSGRTGCYILLDIVIHRICKGVKEIDIAATLEYIRDQRMNSVDTQEQFEFVLSAVAEEVQALLKALPE